MADATEYLRQIRDQLVSRGAVDKRNMLTSALGVETPLVMADVSSKEHANLVGYGLFFGIDTFTCSHYAYGEVIVSVDSTKPAALITYGAEVRVIGRVGSIADVLGVSFVNTGTGAYRVLLPLGSAFTTITIDARQIVNGAPSSNNPSNDANMVGAMLNVQYSARLYR